MWTSVPQMVVVVMRNNASLGPTSGIGFSTTSIRPGSTNTAAFIMEGMAFSIYKRFTRKQAAWRFRKYAIEVTIQPCCRRAIHQATYAPVTECFGCRTVTVWSSRFRQVSTANRPPMDAFACRKIGHPIKGEPHHLFQIRTLCATGVHECVVAMQVSQRRIASSTVAGVVGSLQCTTFFPREATNSGLVSRQGVARGGLGIGELWRQRTAIRFPSRPVVAILQRQLGIRSKSLRAKPDLVAA